MYLKGYSNEYVFLDRIFLFDVGNIDYMEFSTYVCDRLEFSIGMPSTIDCK